MEKLFAMLVLALLAYRLYLCCKRRGRERVWQSWRKMRVSEGKRCKLLR